ncbi:hypothetical protein ACI8AA_01540 [Geodermatophilus sp. SYSU D01180]
MSPAADAPLDIAVRIDRLVVESRHAVDAVALRRALADAVRTVVAERGVPQTWSRDARTPLAVIRGMAWDGRGGEQGLARVLALSLYEEPAAPGAPA